ncbi:hypothetical protein DFH09DRAFT_1205309 [Mycena vulgaris]|nr:hypothetical protein DFH09DRAFT_1205309 [Mycena vulgaris]
MLYPLIVCLAWVIIPFSAALPAPADAPSSGLIDFGNLDLSSTPKTCQSTCSGFTEQFDSTCTGDLKCSCTDKVGAALGGCFSCLAGVANTTQAATTGQIVLAQWASVCNAASMPVSTPSLSVQVLVQSASGAASATGSPQASATATSTATEAPSSSPSGKPNHGDGLLHQTSALTAVVGALLATLFV